MTITPNEKETLRPGWRAISRGAVSRRLLILLSKLLAIPLMTIATEEHAPSGLMTNLLTNPERSVITDRDITFSWLLNDSRQGALQTAFQILVASTEEELARNNGDKWDSGKVGSEESIGVQYGGIPLEPRSSYWWKVRVWDLHGDVTPYSSPQRFFTGDFDCNERKWPGESRWVSIPGGKSGEPVFENRHTIEYHEIAPVSVERNSNGNHLVIFERAAFGTLALRMQTTQSAEPLVIHLGEKASVEGDQVDRDPGGSITYKRAELILEQGKTEHVVSLPRQISRYPNSQILACHMPEVTAFRFAEIENYPGELKVDDVVQLALLYPFDDDASAFVSSNENLNQIWELSKHTLKATPFMGLYIDGARERMPYEADSFIQQISHYCVDREYAIGRYTTEFLIFNPSWPTEWHLHVVMMAWADYMQTGDTRSLARYYDELKAKTLLALARDDGLISTHTGLVTDDFLATINFAGRRLRDIVDWPQGTPANEERNRSGHGSVRIEGETDRFVFSEINTVVNAFHYRNLALMTRIAALLGKENDSSWFEERAANVKRSFNAILLNHETGLYRDGEGVEHSSLHANMFPAAFGLVPDEYRGTVLQFIKSRGMACSPYGAPYLMSALYALGGVDHALSMLLAEDDRSWMNMIRIGSTMTTEAWDMRYKRNMTWNHAWGASPVYTVTRQIMGIVPLEPTFRRIRVHPQPGKLSEATITTPTIRGPVTVSFKNEPGESFELNVVLPPNTSGQVLLPRPTTCQFTLTHNGHPTEPSIEGDSIVIDPVEAGRHEFKAAAK